MSYYKTWQSDYISKNQSLINLECEKVISKFNRLFPETNPSLSTNEVELNKFKKHEGYLLYNVFSAAAPSIHFFNIFEELRKFIFSFCQEDKYYFQAWLNYQTHEQVLDWHRHRGYAYHGYISIDPQATETEFESFKVKNEVGLFYIGKCEEKHRVVNLAFYTGKRITIGFDVIEPSNFTIDNMGFVPISRNL